VFADHAFAPPPEIAFPQSGIRLIYWDHNPNVSSRIICYNHVERATADPT